MELLDIVLAQHKVSKLVPKLTDAIGFPKLVIELGFQLVWKLIRC